MRERILQAALVVGVWIAVGTEALRALHLVSRAGVLTSRAT